MWARRPAVRLRVSAMASDLGRSVEDHDFRVEDEDLDACAVPAGAARCSGRYRRRRSSPSRRGACTRRSRTRSAGEGNGRRAAHSSRAKRSAGASCVVPWNASICLEPPLLEESFQRSEAEEARSTMALRLT